MKKLNRKFLPVYDTFPDRLDYVFPLAESCAATEPLIPINELWVFWRVQVETPNQDLSDYKIKGGFCIQQ